MALILGDRIKETTTVAGTGTATLLGATTGFQSFAAVGNGNTTYYCIADQGGPNWEVGIGTYTASGTTLARTTVLASSNAGALVTFTAGIKDVFVTYPAEKGVWLDASGNAIGLGTPAAFVGTNITGTASGLTAGNVTTNANLTGAITSVGNATSLGSFTSLQLATALTNETGTGSAVFSDNASLLNPTYTGTLTGSTGILNIGAGQLYKDASGNVGIGTSSPAKKLDVLGEAQISFNSINTYLYYQSTNNYTGRNTDGNMWMNVAGGQHNIFGVAGAEKMRIDSSGNVGIGTSSPTGKLHIVPAVNNYAIKIDDGTYSGGLLTSSSTGGLILYNGVAQPLGFWTNNTERMRIDASGNVGIGTSSPGAKLDISNGMVRLSNAYQVQWFNGATQLASILADSGPNLTFQTGSSNTERMRIDSSGNVGIGTVPTAKLDIVGTQWVRGGAAVGGVIILSADATSGANGVTMEASFLTGGYGPLKFRTSNTEAMRIDSSGNLLVGTTSATPSGGGFVVKQGSAGVSFTVTDHTSGTATNQYYSVFTYAGTVIGHIDQSGTTGVSYVTTSDQRLKENIVDAPSALASVNAIKVRSFDWKSSGEHQEYGYIAQELLEVAPEAVSVPTNEDQMMGVDFGKLTPRLVKAIQELKAIIDTQQEQINSLLGK
jgi:hypothetical protein